MKKHWLRGLLLGVSVALLLAGGVALAAPMVGVDPWCGVCCSLGSMVDCVELTDNHFTLTTQGWGDFEELLIGFSSPPPSSIKVGFGGLTDSEGYFDAYLVLFCESAEVQELANYFGIGGQWSEEQAFGEWEVRVIGDTEEAVTHFYFAEDPSECQVQEEFVPEPGTLMLVGGGLVGLAGYATLRWRARE